MEDGSIGPAMGFILDSEDWLHSLHKYLLLSPWSEVEETQEAGHRTSQHVLDNFDSVEKLLFTKNCDFCHKMVRA